MDTNKLLAFMETVRIGSINKAAEELGYTQSGLTYTLNKLEEELGVRLMVRMHHGIRPTSQGEALLPYARNILLQESNMHKKIRQMQEENQEVIRLGVYPSWVLDWAPHLIRCFKRRHPTVNFEIHTGVHPLKHYLEEHLIDLAICEKSILDRSDWQYLLDDDMYVAVNAKSPLAARDIVSLSELQSYTMVPSVITDGVVMSKFRELGIAAPKIAPFYSEDGSMMLSWVSQNNYISFVTRLYESECPENVLLKPTDPPMFKRMGYCVSDHKKDDPLIGCFIKTLTTTKLNYE